MGKIVDLPTIHGVPIPENNLCLVLSWAAENHPAPCLLGRKDLDENQLLHKNMLYAFPKTMLKRFIKKDSKYFLLPLNQTSRQVCVEYLLFFVGKMIVFYFFFSKKKVRIFQFFTNNCLALDSFIVVEKVGLNCQILPMEIFHGVFSRRNFKIQYWNFAQSQQDSLHAKQ